ncbi:hypothetical protein WN943_016212 [Citrus x changshan-huyou]
MLQDLSPKGLHGAYEWFCGTLREGETDKRVQILIEGLLAVRKAKIQGYLALILEVDLVKIEDQLTHEDESKEEVDDEEKKEKNETETSLANLRRKNFLTIMSCVDFEEAIHKPLKIKLEADQEME